MSRDLPVYIDEPVLSAFGTMLFPGDPDKAEAFVALRLVKAAETGPGILTEYRATGRDLEEQRRRRYDRAIGSPNRPSEKEVGDAASAGSHVGELVKVLWILAEHHRPRASVAMATKIVDQHLWSNQRGASRGSATLRLKRFAPVAHLWGALIYRKNDLKLSSVTDLCWLSAYATFILGRLRAWRSHLEHYRGGESTARTIRTSPKRANDFLVEWGRYLQLA
jgi:hypothetical protein